MRVGSPLLTTVVVAAVAVTVLLTSGPSGQRRAAERNPTSNPPHQAQASVSRAQLRSELTTIATRLVDDFPAPSNSRRTSRLTSAAFPGPSTYQGKAPVITRSRFWIVSASSSILDVARPLTTHRPAGLTLISTATGAGGRGSRFQLFEADDRWQPRGASVPAASVGVTVAAIRGGRTGVRIDASAYVEPRTSAQTIPSSVTSAQLVVRRRTLYGPHKGQNIVRRTVSAMQAYNLANVVNHLPVQSAVDLNIGCPMQQFALQEDVTFAGPGPTRAVDITPVSCAAPRATTRVGARTVHPSLDGTKLVTAVLTAAGLPTDYGSR